MAEAPYYCGTCGEIMSRKFGETPYPQSGLANVVLQNVPMWVCANGHRDVQIPAVDQLHSLLASAIVVQPWSLKGNEIKFLRKFLSYSARDFSALIGVHHVTLSDWETNKTPIVRQSEALIRLAFAELIRDKFKRPFPKPLIPVLESLEKQGTFPGDLRLEHVEVDQDSHAEPNQYWQETGNQAVRPPIQTQIPR
jgi:DNA-binding transcriptional regulator YiaG